MSDLNPYPADPYHQGATGTPYPTDFDGVSQSASAVLSTQNGYYSADDLGDQSPRFPAAPGGQYQPYGHGVYWGAPYDPRRHEANALGGWALGLGIASIVANCLSFGLILGISAIVVGVLGMRAANEGRASNKGLSIAGVVTGAIGAVIGACYLMLFIVMLSQ